MFKIKDGYILHSVGGENVVIASGQELDLNQMITLNDTGCFLWKLLEKDAEEESLVQAILGEYEVEEDRAREAVKAFLARLKENELLA